MQVEIQHRPLSRKIIPARRTALLGALAALAPIALATDDEIDRFGGGEARVRIAGCASYIDAAKQELLGCMSPDARQQLVAQQQGAAACGDGLRYVDLGTDAAVPQLAAAAAFTVTITLGVRFYPILVSIGGAQAPNLSVTQVTYGPTDAMLPGGAVGGEQFSTLNEQGGYRLKARKWYYPGQKITITGSAVAAIAAAGLASIQVGGFTDS